MNWCQIFFSMIIKNSQKRKRSTCRYHRRHQPQSIMNERMDCGLRYFVTRLTLKAFIPQTYAISETLNLTFKMSLALPPCISSAGHRLPVVWILYENLAAISDQSHISHKIVDPVKYWTFLLASRGTYRVHVLFGTRSDRFSKPERSDPHLFFMNITKWDANKMDFLIKDMLNSSREKLNAVRFREYFEFHLGHTVPEGTAWSLKKLRRLFWHFASNRSCQTSINDKQKPKKECSIAK